MTTADGFSDAQIRAMDAIFSLTRAIKDGGLSIGQIHDVVKMAVADSHSTIVICLQMASSAVNLAWPDDSPRPGNDTAPGSPGR